MAVGTRIRARGELRGGFAADDDAPHGARRWRRAAAGADARLPHGGATAAAVPAQGRAGGPGAGGSVGDRATRGFDRTCKC